MNTYDLSELGSVSDNHSKYQQYFEETNGSGYDISVETFFQLLMAEMTNQDPLEPTSNTEFISQLASFASLQNSDDTLYYNSVAYASDLVGQNVTVSTIVNGKSALVSGIVTGVNVSDSDNITISLDDGNSYSLKKIVNMDGGSSSSYSYNSVGGDGSFAVSLIGKTVMVKMMSTEDGDVVLEEGVVDSVEVTDGEYRITIGDYSYGLSSVVRVRDTDGTILPAQTVSEAAEETDV